MLIESLTKLHKQYGDVELLEPRAPFALIVWENCAYLVDDERRAQTFANLRKTIGIAPEQLVAAGTKKIGAAIRDGGMQPPHRAAKVFESAQRALDVSDEEWSERKVLKRFPGIADPGVDKILLLCGFSNATGARFKRSTCARALAYRGAGTSLRGCLSSRHQGAFRR